MTQRQLVLIDATLESIAPSFAQDTRFQTWLHSYDDMETALKFINEITPPYTLDVFLARDHIQDEVQLPGTNDPARPILDLLSDLKTILHVTILCPDDNTVLEQIIRGHIASPRMLKQPVAKINSLSYICKQGIEHLEEQIAHYKQKNEIHLISNVQKNINELMEYFESAMNDRKRIIEAMEEAHSNKPGEEPS